ncbi:PREDICTED: melanoma-associated antigen B4-like [Galeopterus variegatus]|uniref:Melanoma-associated antigen B4-like n=1 Tax=Galeopterus variegatus TaxID=482537 RepID=A0ABM0R4C5_GALVR|nr:PREDICTED: melanoma-associated antigen B4-like [Galeopterus variegatus]
MPQGQKSKLRAREKHQQTRRETQCLRAAKAAAAQEEESPSSSSSFLSSPAWRGTFHSSPDASIPQEPQRAPSTSSPDAGVSSTRADEDAETPDENSTSTSQAAPSTQRSRRDLLTKKASMLVQFLLEKYSNKEPITKADMLKVVNKKYKEHLPEILRRTSERLELVLGLELKEVSASGQSFDLVSKLGPSSEGNLSGDERFPRTGLLLMLPCVIFMNGNRANEEEIWAFLHTLGMYAWRRHLVYGEPQKLISKDLVQEKYLEYRQVPNRDPPSCEFLWGPKAHAETSKMEALEILAKIDDTVPSSFPNLYEDALRDEVERAVVIDAGRVGTVARARVGLRPMPRSSSHI